jgi:hypothetical protein
MNWLGESEAISVPQGFGVRQSSAAFGEIPFQGGRGLPQSKTLARLFACLSISGSQRHRPHLELERYGWFEPITLTSPFISSPLKKNLSFPSPSRNARHLKSLDWTQMGSPRTGVGSFLRPCLFD